MLATVTVESSNHVHNVIKVPFNIPVIADIVIAWLCRATLTNASPDMRS